VHQIAFGLQEMIATFLEFEGTVSIDPGVARFFEFPIAGALPEELNFIP
jgi:hypothetical protein